MVVMDRASRRGPRALSVAVAARRGVSRAITALQYGVDALTLGLFPDPWLDALTAEFYRDSQLYPSDEHTRSGLFDWEEAAINATFPTSGRVLVTSAGAGRESIALLARGLDVVATECVPTLHARLLENLEQARGARHATALLTPPDAVPEGPFDAAVIGWAGYTHLMGRARRAAFLRRLAGALAPGAPLLLSYLGGTPHHRATHAVATVASALRAPLGRRRIEPGETTLRSYFGRYYDVGEVTAEVTAAGFRIIRDELTPYAHVVALAPD